MKITNNLLRSRIGKSATCKTVKYLNLSSLRIEYVNNLSSCHLLTLLDLQNNCIEQLADLDCCPHLWKINLANNKLRCINGLSRFLALGTLILSNNDLSWPSISRLQHIHIMNLSLHGNRQMEKHSQYRHHVIDCLPLIWVLDARIISSAEQQQVCQFFRDSALTKQPERHQFYVGPFTASSIKYLQLNAVFGPRAIHMKMRFALNDVANRDLDSRRLQYLAYNLQEDLALETKHVKWVHNIIRRNGTFLEDLLEIRKLNNRRCSLFVLLLLGTMEFGVPTNLLHDTLELAHILSIGHVQTMDIFRLPKEIRCLIACLIVNAIKVEKDHGENGGLYDKLYLCMLNTMIRMMRLVEGSASTQHVLRKSMAQTQEDSTLIASEMTQVLVMVPSFFNYLITDLSIVEIVKTACPHMQIDNILDEVKQQTTEDIIENLSEKVCMLILMAARDTAMHITNQDQLAMISCEEAHVLNTSKALPMRPLQEPIYSAEYLTSGRTVPVRAPTRVSSAPICHTDREQCHVPEVGEEVLLAALTVGHIISLPEPTLLLVQLSAMPVESGGFESSSRYPPDHLIYVDLSNLQWDAAYNFWRPKGSSGDRVSMSYTKSIGALHVRVSSRYGPIHTIPQTGLQHVYCVTPVADRLTTPDVAVTPVLTVTPDESAKEVSHVIAASTEPPSAKQSKRPWLIPVPELELLDKLMGETPQSADHWIQLYTRSLSSFDELKARSQPTSPRILHTVQCNRDVNMLNPVPSPKPMHASTSRIKVQVPAINEPTSDSAKSSFDSSEVCEVVGLHDTSDVNHNVNATTTTTTSEDEEVDEDRMSSSCLDHWVVAHNTPNVMSNARVHAMIAPRRQRAQTSRPFRANKQTSRLSSALSVRTPSLALRQQHHTTEQLSTLLTGCHSNCEEASTASGVYPPQRPSTPTTRMWNTQRVAAIPLRQTHSWLAGGRNIHADMISRSRPKSCSSALLVERARRRPDRQSATPRIVAPSSMLNESIYGSQKLQQRTSQW